MFVLLPPSETKSGGGDGPPLDLDRLSFPELNPVRTALIGAVTGLASDLPASLAALSLSQRQASEVDRNAQLRSSPTCPALTRYTGVLYEALDVRGLSRVEWARAQRRLAIASALFGVVRGGDPIPAYRLSASSTLPVLGSPRRVWHPDLSASLSTVDGLVVDLRSGPYAALARVPGAISVRVVSDTRGGRREAISHHNKAHKGRLAGALATVPREPTSVAGVLRVAAKAGIRMERRDHDTLELVVPS